MLLPLILWIVIIVIVFPISAFFLIPLTLWRVLVNLWVYAFRPDLVSALTSRDLVFTSDDYYGKARKSVISTIVMEGPTTIETLRQEFKARILDKPYFYRMHCRPVTCLGYWFWQRTVVQMESQIIELKETHTDLDLKSLLPQWVSTGYSPGSPLWNLMLVPLTGNRAAVVVKLHHLVGDGVAFMKLLEEFSDDCGWTNLQTPEVRSFSWAHWIYAWYNFPWKALKAYRLARTRKGFRPKVLNGDGLTCWTALSLEKIRVVRRAEKCLFPTVLASVISSAFHRLLLNSGKSEIPDIVRMVIPTPWPNRPTATVCNHVAWLHAEVPLGDPKVIKKFETSLRGYYTSGLHGIVWQVFRGLYLLPKPCLAVYTNWGERNLPPVILSSIPGSTTPVTLLGNRVKHSFPILALGCSMGVNACVTTYSDGAYVTIRVSKEVVPSQELLDQLLSKYLHEELDALYNKVLKQEKEASNNHVKIVMS